MVVQQHNASIKNLGSFYLSPLPPLSLSSGSVLSWLQDGCGSCGYHSRQDNVHRGKETSFSTVFFFFFFLRKASPRSSSRFPHTSFGLNYIHAAIQTNYCQGNGFLTHPWTGAKSMHRQQTVSAFPRLPLP